MVEKERSHPESHKPAINRSRRFVSVALISVGLLMLAGVGSYFGYASYADSHLKELNFSAEEYVESSLADAQDTLSELASHGSEGPPDSSPGPDADPHAGVQDTLLQSWRATAAKGLQTALPDRIPIPTRRIRARRSLRMRQPIPGFSYTPSTGTNPYGPGQTLART